MADFFTFGTGLGDVGTDLVIGEIVAAINSIVAFINALISGLNNVISGLVNNDLYIFGVAVSGLGAAWRALKALIDIVKNISITGILVKLRSLYDRLAAWVNKLRSWLQRLQQLQQSQQMAAIRRVVNLIQRVRSMLVVLRIFHVKWAGTLDTWLAGLESRLISRTFGLFSKTNEIIGWLNVILLPTGQHRGPNWWAVIGGDLKAIRDVFTAADIKIMFPSLVQNQTAAPASLSFATITVAGGSSNGADVHDLYQVQPQASNLLAGMVAEMGTQ